MSMFLITFAVLALCFAGLAVGVIFQGERKVLKGSCGGPDVNDDCCQTCPEREACEDGIDMTLKDEIAALPKKKAHPSLGQLPAS